jgi:hypothetical protein
MKNKNTILTLLSLVALSSTAAYAGTRPTAGGGHTESAITLREISTYQNQGYDVTVGDVMFDAGPSELSIPGLQSVLMEIS